MYNNVKTLLAGAREQDLPLHQVILEDEKQLTGRSEAEIYERLETHYDTMVESAKRALDEPQETIGNLISGQSRRQNVYAKGETLSGTFLNDVMAMAFSSSEVNAGMGRICAAPTAGACGILPAVLYQTGKRLGSSRKQLLDALLVASGFGAIITKNATVSGAKGGCQAECGAAAAMAGAAAVYLAGGTPEMCADACAIALMNCLGLICDPVAGLVQLPCSFRNSSQAANALISADMALAGQKSVIPADEVIESMYRVGRQLPSALRETSMGGIAISKTAMEITKELGESDAET